MSAEPDRPDHKDRQPLPPGPGTKGLGLGTARRLILPWRATVNTWSQLNGVVTREAVGKVLRDIRLAKGLTLEDVAFPADTDPGGLSKVERGLQGYPHETMARLAHALETRLSEIYALAEASKAGLGERLRTARDFAELTQQQLAERSSVSQQMISKLELGHAKETADIVPLAVACGVRPEWLFDATAPMAPAPYTPDTLRLAQVIQSLPTRHRAYLEAVARLAETLEGD